MEWASRRKLWKQATVLDAKVRMATLSRSTILGREHLNFDLAVNHLYHGGTETKAFKFAVIF